MANHAKGPLKHGVTARRTRDGADAADPNPDPNRDMVRHGEYEHGVRVDTGYKRRFKEEKGLADANSVDKLTFHMLGSLP